MYVSDCPSFIQIHTNTNVVFPIGPPSQPTYMHIHISLQTQIEKQTNTNTVRCPLLLFNSPTLISLLIAKHFPKFRYTLIIHKDYLNAFHHTHEANMVLKSAKFFAP